jgi:hypothetical protein
MRRSFKGFSAVILSGALFLSGCGEGWVTEAYHGVPYTEERTASHGVQYVRAKLAPPAGPVVEPKVEPKEETESLFGPEWTPALEGTEVPADEKVEDAAPLFDQSEKK